MRASRGGPHEGELRYVFVEPETKLKRSMPEEIRKALTRDA
jgi:acyl-CoA thioesterase FadM